MEDKMRRVMYIYDHPNYELRYNVILNRSDGRFDKTIKKYFPDVNIRDNYYEAWFASWDEFIDKYLMFKSSSKSKEIENIDYEKVL
jgi:hypothetical protein